MPGYPGMANEESMMPNSIRKKISYCSVIFMMMIILGSCQHENSYRKTSLQQGLESAPHVRKIVVIGFRPALNPREKPGMIRNPISGAVFVSEPVPPSAVHFMNEHLFKQLLEDKIHEFISPGQAKGVLSTLVSKDLVIGDTEIIQEIGKAFSADAVLIGYLYRWRERIGTDYAIDRPASVAFDLNLIQSGNGAILWSEGFDKSQRSLSENLLDMDAFIYGGGKWMTVDRLADFGLTMMLKKMPEDKAVSEE